MKKDVEMVEKKQRKCHNIGMKRLILLLCLFIPLSAFAYQGYDTYTVIGKNGNISGYVQRQGNTYYNSNGSTYYPQNHGTYYGSFNTYQKLGNTIQDVTGKRYIQMDNLIYEE